MLDVHSKMQILKDAYGKARKRLILLDYDGTLAPIESEPSLAIPTISVLTLLGKLSNDPGNEIVVISGREQNVLEKWLGQIPITLTAEHGAFHKEPNQLWQSYFSLSSDWKSIMRSPMKALEAQFEHSFVEEKNFSMTWHYRNVRPVISNEELRLILSALRSIPNKIEFIVYEESCAIELRTVGIDKGRFAQMHILKNGPYEFILALGDGRTDEDLFHAIGKENFTVRVGRSTDSSAQFYIERQEDVIPFLTDVTDPAYKVNLRVN